ncbi:hypothetical protein KT71_003441 [Congregibacter litoralis KT71]|uniref:Uncharacterized protein n=1 Tax=Congregibacter litoralis KT71 TaxID=314285 RepID=V7HS37_9GAMM|nr:hypothetical protein KT71_003441 [Congregibacter litoralis KT71]
MSLIKSGIDLLRLHMIEGCIGGSMRKSNAEYELRNCSWGFKCEQTWDSLIVTDSSVEKYCSKCDRSVHLCDTLDDLAITVANNQCAAFPSGFVDPTEGKAMVVGNVESGMYLHVKPT